MTKVRAAAFPVGHDIEALCREIAERLAGHDAGGPAQPFPVQPLPRRSAPAGNLVARRCEPQFARNFCSRAGASRAARWFLEPAAALGHRGALGSAASLGTFARLEATAEEVCDDFVVQFGADRTRYAGHLLELAGRALPPVAPASVGMVSLRSMLARRIVRILDTSRSLSTRAGRPAVAAMFTLGLAGTVLAGLLGVGAHKQKAVAELRPNKPRSSPNRRTG